MNQENLKEFFNFTHNDLKANQNGMFSPGQLDEIHHKHDFNVGASIVILIIFFAGIALLVFFGTGNGLLAGGTLGLGLFLGSLLVRRGRTTREQLNHLEVKHITDYASVKRIRRARLAGERQRDLDSPGTILYRLEMDDLSFAITEQAWLAIQDTSPLITVYYYSWLGHHVLSATTSEGV